MEEQTTVTTNPAIPWVVAFLACALASLGVYYADQVEHRRYKQELRSETLEQLSHIRAGIEGKLNSDLQLFAGLVAQISLHPDIAPSEIEEMIKALMAKRDLVRSIGVSEGFIVRHVFPLKGNEKALGLNYLANESQREPVLRAVSTRQNVLAGPITLVQGGQALIGRLPIFSAVAIESMPAGSFWGMVSIVIDIDKLFDQVGLSAPDISIDVAIRGRDGLGEVGETFWGDGQLFDEDTAFLDLSLPGGRWQIAGAPNETMLHTFTSFRNTLRVMGSIVVLLFGLAAFFLSRQLQQQLMIIEVQERSKEQIWYAATHDPLTGMANRHLFNEELVHLIAVARRNQNALAVLFLDLDGFKDINDSFSHQMGDLFLKEFAKALSSQIRASELVARLGGDEFAIVSGDFEEGEDAAILAQRITDLVSKPIAVGQNKFHIGVSIGIAVYPDDGETPDELLHNADLAMYRSKESPLNNYTFFKEKMNQEVQAQKNLVSDIRAGLDGNQFSLAYQPIIDLSESRVIGIEALARWQHPQRGTVSPGVFIPAAEKSGLIIPFGEWVLKQACHEVIDSLKNRTAPVELSINLSPIQLHRGNPQNLVKTTLERYQLSPAALDIEITESAILEDVDKATKVVRELRRLGVSVTIDDFGTGYSSLSHLRHLPVNRIKIDLSFVRRIGRDAHSEAIIKAILFLSNTLNIRATAEGVETRAQLDFLKQHGCSEIQGYYFSKPLTDQAILRYIKDFSLAECCQSLGNR
ncbi:bifunctional diguanylate cyclase/phosphodiesterase [Motiliproteus sp. MSK22-1]|uniref:putative bifunctional diguanylate cyclase/phosphodiesterase n=1 Tax=Motiliproteus sp. MSK22-1 TaxID=1897630 RepID=UPI000978B3B8|nr:EAL domain-containing protein [Motiliproteus sp. MSK22-1]OMH33617.1 hypothetical protein BGP75_11380 [Motiliproteus sp. MSK22-1]